MKITNFLSPALTGFICASVLLSTVCKAQTGAPAAAPAKRTCRLVQDAPAPGDTMIARKDYKQAEAAFRDALTKQKDPEDSRLGLVRAMIGQDQVAAATTEAATFLHAAPHSAVAEVAVAEAAYRAADIDAAFAHAKTALANDFCEGRAHAVLAQLFDINALFGSAAAQMEIAHKLRPTDELIQRDWIDSLPRKRREAELTKYLSGDHALSQDDSRDYDNELSHLKARKPGECRITSASDIAKTPMKPVFGDNSHPVAYGLDVSFDGKRRRMQIDTGASGILLTQSAARGLGLQPEYRLKTGGIGDEGDAPSYLAHVHSIRIGDVEVTDCMVEVVTKSKLDVDGLIGMDVFERWVVTLDYQNAELRLAPLPPRPGSPPVKKLESNSLPGDIGDESDIPKDRYAAPEMKDWLSVARIGHEILLPASIRKDAPMTHFMIMDTGASQSVLSNTLGKEGGKLHSSSVEFTGLSGKVKKVYETDQLPLFIGNIAIPPAMYYAYDITNISHNSGFETAGLLGLPTLQRVLIQIDYRDNLIKFTYDRNHDVQRF
jgi:hypothetical protein